MTTKRFTASLAPYNTVKIYDAELGELLRTMKIDGVITSQPVIVGSVLTLEVKKENILHKNTYTLPQGTLKQSETLTN